MFNIKQRFDSMENQIKTKTFYEQRNPFSELHYQLRGQYCMFDIDLVKAEWLNVDIESSLPTEKATYIEYRKLKNGNGLEKFDLDTFKPKALFEYKYKMLDHDYEKFISFKPGGAPWAELMFCKMTNMRFFLVIATDGKQPYKFVEFDMIGKVIEPINILNYDNSNYVENVNVFWDKFIKIKAN